ncbi:STAS domain-containing protein [Plantactinospora siamensis]|uniref:Anti-sigma factor antagonist n=1 Tax=Plantactinospora siamensis TaxID=555372 RepID=A0ABV6NTV4_9ACTN
MITNSSDNRQRPTTPAVVRSVSRAGSTARIHLTGEVDMSTAEQVGKAVAEALNRADTTAPISRIELDLSAVTFLDSSGIRELLEVQANAAERGCRLVVRGTHGTVARVLEISGVTALLAGTIAEAD